MSLKDQAKSVAKKISNISAQRGTDYLNVLTEFLIERLIARLMHDRDLKGAIVFKGGYVGLKVYRSPRYTIDLDAVLQGLFRDSAVERIQALAERDLGDAVWFKFETTIKLETQGEYGGTRMAFRAGIGEILSDIRRAQAINFDLGVDDPITPGPVEQITPSLLDKTSISWQVYPIETAIAEKVHALAERGSENSRAKDIYDLHLFLQQADPQLLNKALLITFRHRKTDLPSDLPKFLENIDLSLLKRGWPSAVSSVKNPPSLEDAFKIIVQTLRRNKDPKNS